MWGYKKLDEICDITSSKRIFYNEYTDEGIPFYRSKEIIEKSLGKEIANPLYIDETKFNNIKQRYGAPKARDILITSVGTIGTCYMVKNKDLPFYFKDGNLTWINKYYNIVPEYLYYLLTSETTQYKIRQNLIGSTQQALTISTLKSLELFITTDIKEQQAIADVLSSFDDKIELNNKIIKNLEEQAQSLYKHWFVDFEFPDKDGKPYKSNGGTFKEFELGLIPEDWEIYKIKDLTTCLLGGTPSRNREDYWNGDIPWINSGKVNDFRITKPSEYITEAGLKNSATKYMSKNTIVLAITGATLGQISILGINTCANQSVVGISETQQLPHEYLYCCLTNRINEILSHQTGGAQQHINKENIEEFKLIYNEDIVREFKNFIESTFEKQLGLAIENQKLIETRDYLLPKLMNGEIKVSDIK